MHELGTAQPLRVAVLSTYLVQNLLARIWKLDLFLKCVTHFVQFLTVSPIIEGTRHANLIGIGMGPVKKEGQLRCAQQP
jgi:hypothetical protein